MAKKINVKKLREATGLKQGPFAAKLGVNQSTISRLEAGTMTPKGPLLKLLEGLKMALEGAA